jgi:hypothetical protein
VPYCSYEFIATKPCATEVSQGFWGFEETAKYYFYRGKWWPESESNQRHADFQSAALPTELSGRALQKASPKGEAY